MMLAVAITLRVSVGDPYILEILPEGQHNSCGLSCAVLSPEAPKLHVALAQRDHLRQNVRHPQVLHLVPILLDLQQHDTNVLMSRLSV
jgi:hypothetical protein